MTDYTATAICEGDHRVIDVPGVGTAEASSVDDLEEMARDQVGAMTHTAREEVQVRMRIVRPGGHGARPAPMAGAWPERRRCGR